MHNPIRNEAFTGSRLLGLTTAVILTFGASGCASLFKPRQCNPEVAEQMGYEDAFNGKSGKPRLSEGGRCEKEYTSSSFKKDYNNGYFRGAKDLCTEAKAKEIANQDVTGGSLKSESRFEICSEIDVPAKSLQTKYRKAFEEGFCTEEAARKLGETQGEALEPKNLTGFDAVCSPGKKALMIRAHKAAYDERTHQRCSPIELQAKGMTDARTLPDISAELKKLSQCPTSFQSEAIQAYTKGFNETKTLMLREKEVALQEENARRARDLQERELKMREEALKAQISANAPTSAAITTLIQGQEFLLQCEPKEGKSSAKVVTKNLGKQTVTSSGRWIVDLMDASGRMIDRTQHFGSFTLIPNMTRETLISFRHFPTLSQCTARFEQ